MLYFVSTPIGNMKDMTYRGVEVLSSVDIIACEDTRHSLPLLEYYGIKKKLVSYQKFNEAETCGKIVEYLKDGKQVAVISDAGTPLVSDPGAYLVRALIRENLPFTVVPGANAPIPALILSGLDTDRFAFVGFLPEKNGEREKLLESYAFLPSTLIFYSAPHDLRKTVDCLYKAFGDRRAVLVKEITKLHETRYDIRLSSFPSDVDERGEFVVLVAGNDCNSYLELPVNEHIALYINDGMSKMDAIKKVAKERGVPKSVIYKSVLSDEND